jgi:branched-chain amino acid transport system ATP-binding protein
MTTPLLEISSLSKRFGGFTAVDQVGFTVSRGELVSIIGPNGAGKTTLFNMLTGQVRPSAGTITLDGARIERQPAYTRARLGMGRTFQITKPLIALTALENVMVAAFLHTRSPAIARDRAMEVLAEIGLADRALLRTSALTLSERRRLEVARALALKPRIILLDEVMAGLNPVEIDGAIQLLHRLHARGLTLIVIEHNLKVVRSLSQKVIVLDRGVLIAEGGADDILQDQRVVTAYLGQHAA